MCSATVSKRMEQMARRFYPETDRNFKILIEKSTHMNLSNLKHEFIQLSDYDKIKPLKLLLKEYRKYARKHHTSCIVFCSSIQSARAVEFALAEEGMAGSPDKETYFKTCSLHGDIPPRLRLANYQRFKERAANVLVATDLASRGLDLPFVSHVLNFDCPRTTSDYLHRAGRAGRAGREGFVMTLYRQKDMPLLEEMRNSHENREPLRIRGSAYSMTNKELLKNLSSKGGKTQPRLGTTSHLQQGPKFRSKSN